jgi:hypothetical protein
VNDLSGRKSKIKSWMQTVYTDINNTRDIFAFNLIAPADIGEKEYNQIIDALNKASVIVEDILFELDNK